MDSWSSPNHKSYVAITVHLEHAGKLLMMLLDLVEMAKSHTGVNLGITFASVLKNFGIEDKVSVSNIKSAITHLRFVLQILSITGDNVSNNDTMIQYLGDALDEFPGPANQTRCFVHTVNLVVKAILKPFDVQRTKDINEFNDVIQTLANTFEEEDIDEEEGEDGNNEVFDMNLEPIKSMLLKVCSCSIISG